MDATNTPAEIIDNAMNSRDKTIQSSSENDFEYLFTGNVEIDALMPFWTEFVQETSPLPPLDFNFPNDVMGVSKSA